MHLSKGHLAAHILAFAEGREIFLISIVTTSVPEYKEFLKLSRVILDSGTTAQQS